MSTLGGTTPGGTGKPCEQGDVLAPALYALGQHEAGLRGIFPAPREYVAGLRGRSLHRDDARSRAAGLRHSCPRSKGPLWHSIQPRQNARPRRGGWPAAADRRAEEVWRGDKPPAQ